VTYLLLAALMALPIGEKLSYRVKYGPLTAGTLTLEIAASEEIAGESCYHLVSHLRSNPAYSKLFSLDDKIESYARFEDLVTLRTVKDIHESNYRRHITADFDYENDIVTYSDTSSMMLPGESRDLLSLWYYFRDVELQPGDEFSVCSHVDKRNYDVAVSVSRRETIRTQLGAFRCLVIEMQSDGPAGNGVVYLSDDDRAVPVIIKTKLPLGYITATLTSVRDR
jgi:hypothetical protein